jgi:ketosteroid isomerase-like protein
MSRLKLYGWTALLALASCASQAPAPEIDLGNERASLMAADQAWSATPPDVEKFLAFVAPDASFLPFGMPMAQGIEAIRTTTTGLFSAPGFNLKWNASQAEVSDSADLGYTIGTFELVMNNAEGKPETTVGKYLTAWKKHDDGQWKVMADCFNADGPPTVSP